MWNYPLMLRFVNEVYATHYILYIGVMLCYRMIYMHIFDKVLNRECYTEAKTQ